MEFSMINFMIFLTHILQNTISLISLYYILTPKFSFFASLRIIIPIAFTAVLLTNIDINNLVLRQIINITLYLFAVRILYQNTWKITIFALGAIYLLAAFSEIILFTLFTIFVPQYASLSNKHFLMVCNFCITILYILVLYCFILYWKRKQKISIR